VVSQELTLDDNLTIYPIPHCLQHFLHHTGDGYLYLGEPVKHCCDHLFINENGDFLNLVEFSSSDIVSPRARAPLRADGLQHLNDYLARVQQA